MVRSVAVRVELLDWFPRISRFSADIIAGFSATRFGHVFLTRKNNYFTGGWRSLPLLFTFIQAPVTIVGGKRRVVAREREQNRYL